MSSESTDDDKYSVIYVTIPDTDIGRALAQALVKKRFTDRVNIIPKVPFEYEWEKTISEDSEALLMMKTHKSKLDDLIKYVRINPPYEDYEVISLPFEGGNPKYLKWVGETVPESKDTK